MPEPVIQSDSIGITEFEAAGKISALSRPPAADPQPKGPDGRFTSRNPEPPREPEASPDATAPVSEPEEAPDAVIGDEVEPSDDDIEIDLGDETEQANAPALDMPSSWGKTAEAIWQGLTPEAQQFIRQHDAKRSSGIERQLQDLKAAQEKASTDAQAIEQERLQLANAAQRYQSDAVKRFQAQFGDVQDVPKLAAENPARFVQWQAAYMEVQAAMQEAQQWQQAIQADRLKQIQDFRGEQNAKLAEVLGLDDEPKSRAFEKQITEFVTPLGVTPQRLAQYTAEEILMARDAKRYRDAVAKRKTVETAAKPVPKVIRPGTPTTSAGLNQQSVAAKSQQLRKSGKVEDAAALIKARWRAPGR